MENSTGPATMDNFTEQKPLETSTEPKPSDISTEPETTETVTDPRLEKDYWGKWVMSLCSLSWLILDLTHDGLSFLIEPFGIKDSQGKYNWAGYISILFQHFNL